MGQVFFDHIGSSVEHETRRISLKKETKREHGTVYYRYHQNRLKEYGVNGSNFIKDDDKLFAALEGHENAEEIAKVLRTNIDLEDNHYLNLKEINSEGVSVSHVSSSTRMKEHNNDGDMLESLSLLWDEPNGTQAVLNHLAFYLGDARAWRNGWNAQSFKRHVKRCEKQRQNNSLIWGEFSMMEDGQAIIKRMEDRKLDAQARMERRESKRQAKRDKRFSQMVKAGRI